MTDKEQLEANLEHCYKSPDDTHCYCWWDDASAACCYCGDGILQVHEYRKTATIKAVRVDSLSTARTLEAGGWIDAFHPPIVREDGEVVFTGSFTVLTLEGEMTGKWGDYVAMGVVGEYYPIDAEIFGNTYERVTP